MDRPPRDGRSPHGSAKKQRVGDVKTENETDYAELRRYYLESYFESEAPALDGTSGARLRHPRKCCARLDQNSKGYGALKEKIKKLEKRRNHPEIHQLLHLLREWEQKNVTRGMPLPAALCGSSSTDVVETVDITEEDEIIDVNTFILEKLLPPTEELRVKIEASDDARGPEATEAAAAAEAMEETGTVATAEKATAEVAASEPPEPAIQEDQIDEAIIDGQTAAEEMAREQAYADAAVFDDAAARAAAAATEEEEESEEEGEEEGEEKEVEEEGEEEAEEEGEEGEEGREDNNDHADCGLGGARCKKCKKLVKAILSDNVTVARDLIEEGCQAVDTPATSPNTVLHAACHTGNPEMVRLLLGPPDGRSPVNWREQCYDDSDPSGWMSEEGTPLSIACSAGHIEVTRLLLDAGACPRGRRADGEPPGSAFEDTDNIPLEAAARNSVELTELIIERLLQGEPNDDLPYDRRRRARLYCRASREARQRIDDLRGFRRRRTDTDSPRTTAFQDRLEASIARKEEVIVWADQRRNECDCDDEDIDADEHGIDIDLDIW